MKFISIKERMPPKKTTVILLHHHENRFGDRDIFICEGEWLGEYICDWWSNCVEPLGDSEPIAWAEYPQKDINDAIEKFNAK